MIVATVLIMTLTPTAIDSRDKASRLTLPPGSDRGATVNLLTVKMSGYVAMSNTVAWLE